MGIENDKLFQTAFLAPIPVDPVNIALATLAALIRITTGYGASEKTLQNWDIIECKNRLQK